MATDIRVQATTEVLNHVGYVRDALKGFSGRDVRVQGVLTVGLIAALQNLMEPSKASL
jgi:hypothetical protein